MDAVTTFYFLLFTIIKTLYGTRWLICDDKLNYAAKIREITHGLHVYRHNLNASVFISRIFFLPGDLNGKRFYLFFNLVYILVVWLHFPNVFKSC